MFPQLPIVCDSVSTDNAVCVAIPGCAVSANSFFQFFWKTNFFPNFSVHFNKKAYCPRLIGGMVRRPILFEACCHGNGHESSPPSLMPIIAILTHSCPDSIFRKILRYSLRLFSSTDS